MDPSDSCRAVTARRRTGTSRLSYLAATFWTPTGATTRGPIGRGVLLAGPPGAPGPSRGGACAGRTSAPGVSRRCPRKATSIYHLHRYTSCRWLPVDAKPPASVWRTPRRSTRSDCPRSVKQAQITGQRDATPPHAHVEHVRDHVGHPRHRPGRDGSPRPAHADALRRHALARRRSPSRSMRSAKWSIEETRCRWSCCTAHRCRSSAPLRTNATSDREYDVPLDAFSLGGQLFTFFSSNHFDDSRVMGRSVLTRAVDPSVPISGPARNSPAAVPVPDRALQLPLHQRRRAAAPCRRRARDGARGTCAPRLGHRGVSRRRPAPGDHSPEPCGARQAASATGRSPPRGSRRFTSTGSPGTRRSGHRSNTTPGRSSLRARSESSPSAGCRSWVCTSCCRCPCRRSTRTEGRHQARQCSCASPGRRGVRGRTVARCSTGSATAAYFIRRTTASTVGDCIFPEQCESLGGAYAPYLFDVQWEGNTAALRYTLSTWNPYQVVLMRHDITRFELRDLTRKDSIQAVRRAGRRAVSAAVARRPTRRLRSAESWAIASPPISGTGCSPRPTANPAMLGMFKNRATRRAEPAGVVGRVRREVPDQRRAGTSPDRRSSSARGDQIRRRHTDAAPGHRGLRATDTSARSASSRRRAAAGSDDSRGDGRGRGRVGHVGPVPLHARPVLRLHRKRATPPRWPHANARQTGSAGGSSTTTVSRRTSRSGGSRARGRRDHRETGAPAP